MALKKSNLSGAVKGQFYFLPSILYGHYDIRPFCFDVRATYAVRELLKLCTSPTRSGKGHDVANNSYIVARPWLGRHLLLRGVASAPPAPPTPLGGVADGRASSLRELTSPTHRLRGAASGGITSSQTWKSGNWWQHGLTPKSERRCWKVPLRLDVGLKKPWAGTDSNSCMVSNTLQKVARDGRGPHRWLLTVAQRFPTPFQLQQNLFPPHDPASSFHDPNTYHKQGALQHISGSAYFPNLSCHILRSGLAFYS